MPKKKTVNKVYNINQLKKKAEKNGKIIDWSTLTIHDGQMYVCIVPNPKKIKMKVEVK